jgi:rod shape-determining protein MreB
MINKIFGHFSKDLGIDLGTANTLVYVRNKGIVINEPSVVSINQKTGQVVAIGEEAKKMLGKTPHHIYAVCPLTNGVISDFEATEQMLKYFIDKVHGERYSFLPRPRVVIGIPWNITEVEKRAVEDAAKNAGAREVFLVDEPMAAAVGAGLPIQDPTGSMLVDIGGGTADIAVISLGGIVVGKTMKIAGNRFNEDIINFAKENYRLLLGEKSAENIKIQAGSAWPLEQELETVMRGRDLITGLPKEMKVSSQEIREALGGSLRTLVNAIKGTIEETPPELVAYIMSNGIVLEGGGSMLRNIHKLISEETRMPVHITEDPITAVARGTGIILEDIDLLSKIGSSNIAE